MLRTHPEQTVTIKRYNLKRKKKTRIPTWAWPVSQEHVYGLSNRLLWWAAPSSCYNISGDEVLISRSVIKASQLVNVLLCSFLESVKNAVCQQRGFNQACNWSWWTKIACGLKDTCTHTHTPFTFYRRIKVVKYNSGENISGLVVLVKGKSEKLSRSVP